MKVEGILKAKGRRVETARPDTPILVVLHKLSTMGIGALVVSPDGERVDGVVAERDVVTALNRQGAALLEMRAGDVMARNVPCCSPDDSVKHVMAEMTRTRHRHLPVVESGRLCGIVSIGDVVKNRLEELELEANVLRDVYRASR